MKNLFLLCGLIFLASLTPTLAANVAPELYQALPAVTLSAGAAASPITLADYIRDPDVPGSAAQITVRMAGTTSTINLALYDATAPLTVANFKKYITDGRFTNNFFHRSVPGFIIQTGGYRFINDTTYDTVPTYAAVQNEFGASNVRGTIAMAKLGGDPNSATSQWFINLANNSANLDAQNGGFTVFGRVIGTGMTVADQIASYTPYNTISKGLPWDELPLTIGTLSRANFIETDAAIISPLSYQVTSDNPSLVTAAITDGVLQLTSAAAATGQTTIRITTTDLEGATLVSTISVTVITTTLPDRRDVLTIGTPASLPLAVDGYNTWTTPHTLPAWLSLSSSTGTLTGTPPADTPAFTFLLHAVDANSGIFGQNVTLLFKAPDSPDRAFSPADFTEAVTGRTLAGLNFTGNTTFTDPSEPAGSPYRTGTWTYSSPASNQARIILTYPSANPVTREGIDLYHRGPLATDALRYDLDNSDVASGHQLTSADFRSTFLPRDIAASVVSSRNVSLTWRDEAWTDGYNVYRTTSASTPPAAGATPLNGATALTAAAYTDVAPTRGTALTYWITAVRAGQETTPLSAASTTLTIPDVPLVLDQPTNVLAAVNATQVFNITTLGTGLTYQWFFAGKAIKGATSEDLSLKVTTKSAGTYTLKITDNTGDTTQALVTLRVAVVPKITAQPAKALSLALGGSTTLSVSATGEALSYQWFRNGTALDGKTASTLALTNATSDTSGTYTVRVSNIAGSATTKGTALTVLAPPTVGAITGPSTVATGGAFTLGVTASGPGKLTYQWRLNGTAIPKATKSTYAVKKASSANAGTYTVTITNSVGATTSEPRVLTVSP